MKKKAIYCIGIAVVLLICIIAYYKPLSLSNIAGKNSNIISIIFKEYVVENGKPDIYTVEYKDLTTEQKNAVLALLEKYPYRRTAGTPFSNGSMSGLGNKMLSIQVNDTASGGFIDVTSSGKIAVNAKNYRMNNAEQFIDQLIEIMEQTD